MCGYPAWIFDNLQGLGAGPLWARLPYPCGWHYRNSLSLITLASGFTLKFPSRVCFLRPRLLAWTLGATPRMLFSCSWPRM